MGISTESIFRLKSIRVPSDGPLDEDCIACTPPDRDKLLIGYTEHWKLIAHPWQALIGSCIAATRRHVGRLSELNKQERKEFFLISELLETGLRRAFQIDLLNYACLMNWAYREAKPEPKFKNGRANPHVHWHIFSRFKNPIEFANILFEDPQFGGPYDGDRKPDIPESTIEMIRDEIRSHLDLDY